jgi:mRNA-degrading endonuclease toxin of MazEF toxin-antitoxin module
MPLNENDPINQGEIFWISLPNRGGREQMGRRPCIIMSRRLINLGNPVVAVPMTSETRKASAYNIALPAPEITPDPISRPNVVDSVALCSQVFMVDKRKLEDRFGKLTQNAILAVQLGLSYVFDIR